MKIMCKSVYFLDPERDQKEHQLYETLGRIKERYGKNAVQMAISHTEKATLLKRNKLIGGHNAE